MVKHIQRESCDIFSKPILGFLFKNKKFLFALRIAVAALFFYAIYYGFMHPGKENIFTGAVFWGVFWSLFMVVTLPTFGRIFCGVCPHGFLGKYITRFGLKKSMPKWMQNRYIGIVLLVIGWWAVYYTFDGFWKSPFNTAFMFGVLTLLAFLLYYLYKDMSYCKFICPIGTLTRAYDKLSFTKLETYKSACSECKSFECAAACPYNLKPFTFEKKNQTEDCTLCMECAHACEAVKFKFTKPAQQLSSKLKILGAEVWTYILILASIPVSMGFAHGLNRTNIANDLIWNKTATALGLSEYAGGFAFLYALIFTVFFATLGLYIASKILQKEYKSIFTTLGVAFVPLFIFASLGHTLEMFFYRTYESIIEGFAQGFGTSVDVSPLAKRGDAWLHYFGLLKWVGVIWAFLLLYKRFKLVDATKYKKLFAYFFASFAILFYIGLNLYTGYVFAKYGAQKGGHSHGAHGGAEMFQSVDKEKAQILQEGKDRFSGIVCGMDLAQFYKTNHSAVLEGKVRQYCSIHCLAEDLKLKRLPLRGMKVVDVASLQFIDVKDAFYVVGSSKGATMSTTSKYAFAKKEDATDFTKKYGGTIMDFEDALSVALKDFAKPVFGKKSASIDNDADFYFSLENPDQKKSGRSGHSHGGGRPAQGVPKQEVWLAYAQLIDKKSYLVKDLKLIAYDYSGKKTPLKLLQFEVPTNGYYYIYALKEDAHKTVVAKLEYLRGKHGTDDKYDAKFKDEIINKALPIDLVRIKSSTEDSFYHKHQMGDTLEFQALFEDKPLANAKIKIQTSSGWTKTVTTDAQGTAKFTIIRDYFPKWSKFDKRFKQEILLTLTHEKGDKEYVLTYPLHFYPNDRDYLSYAYGLGIVLIVMFISGLIVYRYRQNRIKPFKEVDFDA
jgi:polyferredoxin/nitrous oxide reductase accessory protein NosL